MHPTVKAVIDARARVWAEINASGGRESDAARSDLDVAIANCRRERRSWQVPPIRRS
jgi:hypothetical protein